MSSPDLLLFLMGAGALVFGIVRYLRKRFAIRRAVKFNEPIAVDGWNTFPAEPEFLDVVRNQQNEAFGQLCHISLYGLVVSAAAFGFDVKPDIFSFLLEKS